MIKVGRQLEMVGARNAELHLEFTHSRFCAAKDHPRVSLPYLENVRLSAREGRDTPGYHTVGCYRPDEINRQGVKACRVPHVVLDVDSKVNGRKDLVQALDDALEIVSILIAAGACQKGIQVLITGGWGLQLRIADGLLGCPIYRTEKHVRYRLELFVERLLAGRADLLEAVDTACLRPHQLVRSPGCLHDKRPRRSTLMPCPEFLKLPLRPHGAAYALTDPALPVTPVEVPAPSTVEVAPYLARLLYHPPSSEETAYLSTYIMDSNTVGHPDDDELGKLSEQIVERIREGVAEGEHWGADCGWDVAMPGRNSASLQLARHITASDHVTSRGRLVRRLEEWNRSNRPPLPRAELRSTAKSALKYVNELRKKRPK